MSYDVEKGLISKILETRDLMSIKDNQIKPDYFTGESRIAYQFIFDTVLKTGEVPTVRVFQKKFPRYKLDYIKVKGEQVVGTEENMKFWCDELRHKVKHNTLADTINDTAEKLQDFETEEAYEYLKKKIAYIESEIVETTDVDITKDTDARKQAYLKRKQTRGITGIPTGFKHLDYLLKGLGDGTLTTVIANTGIGKTWFEVIVGAMAQLQNYTVLQLVTEMSEDIMRDRYEAVLFSLCYDEMNYNAFKSGMLTLDKEKQYFEFLENDLPNFEPLIVATATGVMGVSALIDKYNPDLIMIDGAYLMEDDQGAKDDWLRVSHITRDLKKLAKRIKKPIVINTQADKNTSKKTGPELGSIMYTQAIGQDSDNVLAMFRDEIMINDKEMGMKVLKQREGTLGKTIFNWDFDTMTFTEIYFEESKEEVHDNTLNIMEDNDEDDE